MIVLMATGLLLGGVTARGALTSPAATPPVTWALPPAVATPVPAPPAALAIPAPLTDPELDLRSGPVDVPLELQLPSIGVRASVSAVGITTKDVMDAPTGPVDDPVWQQAFWYRGSAVPGSLSTAVIAGHVNGPRGRSAVFAHLDDLRPGDPVVVRDTRSGLDVRFSVTESKTYSLDEASQPSVLNQIYGNGPVAGTRAQPSADGSAHLTLITCAGTFTKGTHDHRLVVYATRVG